MKVAFFDLSNNGHHWFYNFNIMSEFSKDNKVFYFSSSINEDQNNMLHKSNIYYFQNNKFPNNKVLIYIYDLYITLKFLLFCIKYSIDKVYFIYGDKSLFSLSFFSRLFKIFNIKVIVTLHWFPNKKVKIKWLNRIIKRFDLIIVHTKNIKDRIIDVSKKEYSDKIKVIEYPVSDSNLVNKDDAIKYLNFSNYKNQSLNILYFGGTRYDKGIDILLQASGYLRYSYNIIIAGKIESFDEKFIIEKESLCNNINFINKFEFISENDLKYYFSCSDIIVLPYRKIFNGESGILTECMNFGKVCIVPDILHFPSLINQYKNGLIYKCEDYNDLAKKIDLCFENINKYKKNAEDVMNIYKDIHSISNFKSKYYETLKI